METNANFGMGTNPRESVARQEAGVSLWGTTMGIAGISSNLESAMRIKIADFVANVMCGFGPEFSCFEATIYTMGPNTRSQGREREIKR